MSSIFSVMIITLFLLIPVVLTYIIYSLIKKRQKKSVTLVISLCLGIVIVFLVLYLAPTRLKLQSSDSDYNLTIYKNGRTYLIDDREQKNSMMQLLEGQKYVRNVNIPLNGVPRVASDQYISIRIAGIEVPSNILISVRLDDTSLSYLENSSRYYSINNSKKFTQDIQNFISINL
ncbi:hypothetical protein KCTCHS21_34480 [Cohnella abietis]|uniref:Uncharacterized protein n=1 Tax=Cohnella abietis TaxID=2507935 RepID=A0A3T1D7M2_9BACL|nr:hypothetical protein KCTCHS21_34480 [Cohnella abietis]